MDKIVLISLPIEDLQTVIIDGVNSCLRNNKQESKPLTDQPEQLLTIQQAAELLNLSVSTLYRKVSNGEISSYKFNNRIYFTLNELLRYQKSTYYVNPVRVNNPKINLFKRLLKWLSKNKDLIEVIATIVKNLLKSY